MGALTTPSEALFGTPPGATPVLIPASSSSAPQNEARPQSRLNVMSVAPSVVSVCEPVLE